jgi:(1->4)-alpha-D-glucan 1-alpha-D-glucosylmutase
MPEVERLQRLVPALSVDELAGAVSALPIYRTYVSPETRRVSDEDRAALRDVAPEVARRLLLEEAAPAEFVVRFQQTTPAIMAKGVEDTAFYRYGRLLALNDVGGDPSRFGIGVERFHEANRTRAESFPLNLLTTMTHDAKRSSDARMRIAALAGMAEEFADRVSRWMALSSGLVSAGGAPDDVERYFLFQTLVGVWPIEIDRLEAYLEKALREAKRNTNWVEQNTDWEDAVKRFTRALVADEAFMADFEPFCERVAQAGARAALGQLVLKLTVPGIPDIYQGDELEFRALVDPDNRRPVDWDLRDKLLRRLLGGGHLPDEPKLWVTARLLGLRARRFEPFAPEARYEPLDAGPDCCAFLRGDDVLVVVELRRGGGGALQGAPGGTWREVLGGRELSFDAAVPVERTVGGYGVAVYERL